MAQIRRGTHFVVGADAGSGNKNARRCTNAGSVAHAPMPPPLNVGRQEAAPAFQKRAFIFPELTMHKMTMCSTLKMGARGVAHHRAVTARAFLFPEPDPICNVSLCSWLTVVCRFPPSSALHSHRFLPRRCAMGKHFTGGELDLMHKLKGHGAGGQRHPPPPLQCPHPHGAWTALT